MKVILKMISSKEKELYIIVMVIEKWEIILKMNQLENIYYLPKMEMLKLKIINYNNIIFI